MGASGGGGSSGGGSTVKTYIVPQSRPTISAIQNVSPISTGQSMKPEVAEKQGLESWEEYNQRMYGGKTQAQIEAAQVKPSTETAEQIAKMLKSPTAQFTEKSAQKAFKIVSEAGISLKESDIKAKLMTSSQE